MNYPQTIDYMPNVENINHIKGPIYEGYAAISEESLYNGRFVNEMTSHFIGSFRIRNFFVKRMYVKYLVEPQGVTILAFELVRLRDPVVEKIDK